MATRYLVISSGSIISNDICLVWFYSQSRLSSSYSKVESVEAQTFLEDKKDST
jgi:hypothetical protein